MEDRNDICNYLTPGDSRCIGKSRLIKEFSKYFDYFYTFSGLPPDKKTTAKHQLEEFSRQLSRQFKTAFACYEDWSDAL